MLKTRHNVVCRLLKLNDGCSCDMLVCPECGDIMEVDHVVLSCAGCGLIKTFKKEQLENLEKHEFLSIFSRSSPRRI